MPKTVALCWHLTKTIWGSNQVFLLNYGFEYMATLPEFEKKGIFGTTIFKKNDVGWPAGSDAKTILAHMQGKDVGHQTVWKASRAPWYISLACSNGRQQTYINQGKHMVYNPPKGKEEAPCRRRIGGDWLVWIHALVLFWLSFCRWQQKQLSATTFLWKIIQSSLLVIASIWVYCCSVSGEQYACIQFFQMSFSQQELLFTS